MMENHIHKLLFLLLIGLLPVINSCKEDIPELPCTPETTVTPPSFMTDFFIFKKGSWWVYELEVNPAITDSVWVSVYNNATYNYRNSDDYYPRHYCYQILGINLLSKSTNEPEKRYKISILNTFGNTPLNASFILLESPSTSDAFYRLECSNDSNFLVNGSLNQITRRIADTVVNGIAYHDVFSFSYPPGYQFNDFRPTSLYARYIGPISYTRPGDAKWILKKYQTIQ